MKILLRKLNDKYYVWKDATYEHGKFHITFDDYGKLAVEQTEILAVKDDIRSNSVVCTNCGAIIKNDPKDIEKHFADMEAKRDCFKCQNLRRNNNSVIDKQYTKNADGTYNVTETHNVTLKCSRAWYNSPVIDSEEAKRICTFYQCRNGGVTEIKDVFTEYPDLFKKQITVDVLIKNGFTCDGHSYGYFVYDLKCRNTIKACVNEVGIVDHFLVKIRSRSYWVYYSAEHDLVLFNDDYNGYTEEWPYNMTETKYNQLKAKISALYKEEESE